MIALVLCVVGVSASSVSFEFANTYHDTQRLNWAVQSKIFFEYDDEHMFVTTRGADGNPLANVSKNASLSVYNIVQDPLRPQLVDSFAPSRGEEALEGIDRCGQLLVVVGITNGILYTLNASCVSCGALGALNLSTNRALHVRVYFRPDMTSGIDPWGGCGHGLRGRTFAIVTSGFAGNDATYSDALMAVDVTDPFQPIEVAKLDGMPTQPEGIYVHRDHGYVGGCNGSSLMVVDLRSLPDSMKIVTEIHDPDFVQLVSIQQGYDYKSSTMLLALWGEKGGLASFHIDDNGMPHLLSKLVSSELAKANRVVLDVTHGLAFLPLEQTPAKVAVIDVSDPQKLSLASPVLEIAGNRKAADLAQGKTYCLVVKDLHMYVFVAETSDMHVYRFEMTGQDDAYGVAETDSIQTELLF